MESFHTKEVHQFYTHDPRHVVMDAEIRDDIPPLGLGVIWIIGRVTQLLAHREWFQEIRESQSGVFFVILLAKLIILVLDIIFYLGASYMYVMTCFGKHKKELKILYFTI